MAKPDRPAVEKEKSPAGRYTKPEFSDCGSGLEAGSSFNERAMSFAMKS